MLVSNVQQSIQPEDWKICDHRQLFHELKNIGSPDNSANIMEDTTIQTRNKEAPSPQEPSFRKIDQQSKSELNTEKRT